MLLAKELGDASVAERLQAAAERATEPRAFGDEMEQFGWFFNNKEGYPRGQGSAMLMAAQVASPGDWSRAFEALHLDKYTAPTRLPLLRAGLTRLAENRSTACAAGMSIGGTGRRATSAPHRTSISQRASGRESGASKLRTSARTSGRTSPAACGAG